MPKPVPAPSDPQGLRDRLVGGFEIEALRVEFPSGPATHCLVFVVRGIEPDFEEIEVTSRSADVLGRARSAAGDASGIFYPGQRGDAVHDHSVAPVVAEIIFVMDREAVVLAVRENEVLQPDFGGLENSMVEEAVLVEFWRADDQATDIELVEVAVRPGKRRLKHLMELGEIETDRQLKGAADPRLDFEDVDIGGDDEVVRIEIIGHGA